MVEVDSGRITHQQYDSRILSCIGMGEDGVRREGIGHVPLGGRAPPELG